MHPWCRNVEISENIDAGEGFGPLNPPKSLAGAISMPCGAPCFNLLKAGGKPSTWLPPGGLVEWLQANNIQKKQ